ncbi:hypothetical protein MLD38_023343 [Melastoma candidum]|uniref:Uncharacterized protein n=1 Tax=Melastoma candidum TaxID=119954 RepID=A0ACB9QM75_9MYRT|nr:hypothetical protein MLD38_023343 [Melastoma candidum]
MVKDDELADRLREILEGADLDKATTGSVRRQLEGEFGVDLSDRKGFVRELIDSYLQSMEIPEEEEEDDDDDGEGRVTEEDRKKRGGKEGKGKPSDASKEKKRRGGFTKLCGLSPLLQEFVGAPSLARTEVVRKVWNYIREKDLQDPRNRKEILCDEKLRKLFSVDSIDMFQMNKALAKHIWPLDESIQQKIKSEERSEEDVITTRKGGAGAEDEDEGTMDENEGKKKRSTKNSQDLKKRGGGFNKPCSLSPQLQAVIGEAELSRPEVIKKLWVYIREKNLQDASNKQNIICDELLHPIFCIDSINMFQMNKALSKHILPLNGDGINDSQKKSKRRRNESNEDETEQKDKKPKKGGGGLTAPLPLSDALMKFLGTGESGLSRIDVMKRMWGYIKGNGLQDPLDKRMIICDDKLRELFEVDSFQGFSVMKLLASHFVKPSD